MLRNGFNIHQKRFLNMPTITSAVSQLQISQMEERIPLVDEQDVVLGASSKRECHKQSDSKHGLLHRAFSIFLFNSENKLLLQQRSSSKITFPNHYTNSCCSHPRYNKEELQEVDNLGIKVAAQRRLNYELGIPVSTIPISNFHVLTKIHYFASADEVWCEHEMDYVLFCKADVDLSNVNMDEVQKTMYFSPEELSNFMKTAGKENTLITPWFQYIVDNFLFQWWGSLDWLENVKDKTIHRAGNQSSTSKYL